MNSKLVSPAFGTQETVVSCCLFGLCFCHRILFSTRASRSMSLKVVIVVVVVVVLLVTH